MLEALEDDARVAWWLASTGDGDREIDCEEPVDWPVDHPRVCVDVDLESFPGRFPNDELCLGGMAQIDGQLIPLSDVQTIHGVEATVDLDLEAGEISGRAQLKTTASHGVVAFSACSDTWSDCEVSDVELDGEPVPFGGRYNRYIAAVPPSDTPIELEITWSGKLGKPSVVRPDLVLLYSMNEWLPGSVDWRAKVERSVTIRGGEALRWRGPGVSQDKEQTQYSGSSYVDVAARPDWVEDLVEIDGVTFDIGLAPESADRMADLRSKLKPALQVATEIGPVPSTILISETPATPAVSGPMHMMLPLDYVLVQRPWVLTHELAHQSFHVNERFGNGSTELGEQLTNAVSLRADPIIAESVRHYWRQVVSDTFEDPSHVRSLLDQPAREHDARYQRGGLLLVALEHWIGREAFTALLTDLAARPYAGWSDVVDGIDDPVVADRIDRWVRMESFPELDLDWTDTGIRLSDAANAGGVGPLLLHLEGADEESLPPIVVALEDLPIELDLPPDVVQIEADPEAWLLLRVPKGEDRLVWRR